VGNPHQDRNSFDGWKLTGDQDPKKLISTLLEEASRETRSIRRIRIALWRSCGKPKTRAPGSSDRSPARSQSTDFLRRCSRSQVSRANWNEPERRSLPFEQGIGAFFDRGAIPELNWG